MFKPLSRSRFRYHNVLFSDLYAVHLRSRLLPRSAIRYYASALTTGTGNGKKGRSEESAKTELPQTTKDEKEKKQRRFMKHGGKAESSSRNTPLSSDKKAIAALKASLRAEDQARKEEVARAAESKNETASDNGVISPTTSQGDGEGEGAVANMSKDSEKKDLKGRKGRRKRKAGKTPVIRHVSSTSGSPRKSALGKVKVLVRTVVTANTENSSSDHIIPSRRQGTKGTSTTGKDEGNRSSAALSLIDALQTTKLTEDDKKKMMSQLRDALLGMPTNKNAAQTHGNKDDLAALEQSKTQIKLRRTDKNMTGYDIKTIEAADLNLVPVEKPQPPVPTLAYGLERVLFNPGVYHLRDPRSRVFNFDPYLESIMPVAEFDFNALKEYITSSRDETLISTASAEKKKYTGSTSSMTSALAHFHFLLSQWRPVNISNLSQGFPDKLRTFTNLQRAPSAIFLRWKNGTYAIDADKEFDSANILMMLGKSMEKLLTLPTDDFEKYRKANSSQISEEERNEAESYHYTTMGDFLMRSQLDAYDPRVPGTGMFDLKTRAVVSIRMDAQNYHGGLGYEIRSRHGEFESYEREYYDMIRAAFLKYSLQVRMGRMDGIFVAFHNTERIFGFQYISLPEMDLALHGQDDLTIGDSEFKLSLDLLNRILDRATAKYPEQSLRIFFETREATTPFMYIFAEPVTEDEIQRIQESKKVEIEEYERDVLGIHQERTLEEIKAEQERAEWDDLQAEVEETMDNDEYGMVDGSESEESGVTVSGDLKHESSAIDDNQTQTDNPDETPSFASSSELDVRNDKNLVNEARRTQDEVSSESIVSEGGLQLYGQSDSVVAHNVEENAQGSLHVSDGNSQQIVSEDGHGKIDTPEDENPSSLASEVDPPEDSKGEEKREAKSPKKRNTVLAMTLTIRNKVNGRYVERPEDLGPDDKWSVEYALAEVPKQDRARSLYEKSQKRREKVLRKDKDETKQNFGRAYTDKLKHLSKKGREWRQAQDEMDESQPVKVLGEKGGDV